MRGFTFPWTTLFYLLGAVLGGGLVAVSLLVGFGPMARTPGVIAVCVLLLGGGLAVSIVLGKDE